MAVHKIKAKDDKPKKQPEAKKAKSKKSPKKNQKPAKANKKTFILLRPFAVFGRYIRNSWREIRQVRWPDRKLTWKMTLSVIIYVLIFASVIMLLDVFFTFLFNKLLGV